MRCQKKIIIRKKDIDLKELFHLDVKYEFSLFAYISDAQEHKIAI